MWLLASQENEAALKLKCSYSQVLLDWKSQIRFFKNSDLGQCAKKRKDLLISLKVKARFPLIHTFGVP